MFVTLAVVVVAVVMMLVEALRPGRTFARSDGWWWRALSLSGAQAALLFLAGRAVDPWLRAHRPWSVDRLGLGAAIVVGYLVHAFVYYWWHRARHHSPFLWRWVHQMHHSPGRITILTSFYKHPLEILLNSLISSLVLYGVLGLGVESAMGVMLLCGLAELWYHWNVATPRWLGFFVQRPESHCVHHERGRHAMNYGDLPVFDWLFGTFENPDRFDGECGFGDDREQRFVDLLAGQDVSTTPPTKRSIPVAAIGLLLVGSSQMVGDVASIPALKGLGAATALAPAPKVFTSVRGFETFSNRFVLEASGQQWELSGRLRGPYNRRNVYGAALAYGPVLPPAMRDPVLREALCGPHVMKELGLPIAKAGERRGVRYVPARPLPSGISDTLEVTCP